jgi:hypothetical protein
MKRLRMLGLMLALCAIALSVTATFARNDHDDGVPDDGETEDGSGRAVFVSFLTGGQEVNAAGEPNQGDPDGSAIARVRLAPARERVCINTDVQNVDPLVLAHIHQGAAGANGLVVVDFTSLINGSAVKGCVTASADVIAAIIANPAGYYVNIHSEAFRPGAVRGQLESPSSLQSSFRIELSGAAEVGTPGDPDGSGTARVIVSARKLEACIFANTRNVSPLTLAHIHQGAAGVNGPVVVDFTSLLDGNRVRGCVAANPNIIQAIRTNPAGFYVNVHNADFPRGALRGQLQ